MLIPSSDVTSIIQEFSRFYRSVLASCGQGIFKNVMRVMLIPSSDVTSIIQRLSHFCRSASCGQGIIQEVGITLQQTCLLFDFCYCCRRRSIGFIYKRVKLTCGLNKKVPAVHVLSIDFCRQSKTRRLPRRMLFTFTAASKLNRLLVCIPFSFHGNIFISMEMFLWLKNTKNRRPKSNIGQKTNDWLSEPPTSSFMSVAVVHEIGALLVTASANSKHFGFCWEAGDTGPLGGTFLSFLSKWPSFGAVPS